MLRYLSAS